MGAIRVTDLQPHPTDANKLRVTFSEAFNVPAATTPGNYVFTPSLTVVQASVVTGSSNTKVDLLFGADIAVDGSTHALWRCDEVSGTTAADSGPNSYTFTGTTGINLNGPYKAARTFNGAQLMSSASTLTPRTVILGEWTFEALVNMTAIATAPAILEYAGTTVNLQADNTLVMIGIFSTGVPFIFWETGAGVDTLITPPVISKYLFPVGVPAVLSITKKLRSGSDYAYTFFVNGLPLWTSSNTALPDGGTSGNMKWILGSDGKSAFDRWVGDIDSVHFSSVARSDAYILANAQALLTEAITKGTSYALQVSNVQDAATSTAITAPNGIGRLIENGSAAWPEYDRPLDGLRMASGRNVLGDGNSTIKPGVTTGAGGSGFNSGIN